jgi:integrase
VAEWLWYRALFPAHLSSRDQPIAQTYLDHALIAGDEFRLALSSRNTWRDALNQFWMPTLGRMPIAGIHVEQLQEIDNATAWTTTKTRKNAILSLRQVFAFAMSKQGGKLIASNPAMSLSTAEKYKPKKKKPDPYTTEERDALLGYTAENMPQRVHVYFLTAFYSGMRTGELIALARPKYDGTSFMVDTSRVRRELKGTKTEESRRVLMPDFVCKEINALPSRFKRGAMFLTRYDEPCLSGTELNVYFEAAHSAIGVRRRSGPYPWRHTYASVGLTNGAAPALLAKQLGHSLQMFFTT